MKPTEVTLPSGAVFKIAVTNKARMALGVGLPVPSDSDDDESAPRAPTIGPMDIIQKGNATIAFVCTCCVDPVLTPELVAPRGWKSIEDLSPQDIVALTNGCFDAMNKSDEAVAPLSMAPPASSG